MIADEQPDWSEVSKEQWLVMRPYILDCQDLSTAACNEVRRRFRLEAEARMRSLTKELKRPLRGNESNMLRAELTRHFNEVVIPEIAAEHGDCAGRGEL